MTDVANEEIIFRRVRDQDQHVTFVEGRYKISSQAFSDRGQKPSVDLSSLCGDAGAQWTQEGDENGVLRLLTKDVRALVLIGNKPAPAPRPPNSPKEIAVAHEIDVYPCPVKDKPPLRDNPAHAEIRPNPDWCSKSVFRRLLEALEQIATVEIAPKSVRR